MTAVLIPTRGNDADATYVATAIRIKGHKSTVWLTADFPTRQSQSFLLEQSGWNGVVDSQFGRIELGEYNSVWLRRPIAPYYSETTVNERDLPYLKAVSARYHQSLWPFLCQGGVVDSEAFWVNDFISAYKAESKLLQLKEAARRLHGPPHAGFKFRIRDHGVY